MADTSLSPEHLHILRHSLGVGDRGTKKSYRNHFVTGEGSVDYPGCMHLVGMGYMKRRDPSPLTGGDFVFIVTSEGKDAAKP